MGSGLQPAWKIGAVGELGDLFNDRDAVLFRGTGVAHGLIDREGARSDAL